MPTYGETLVAGLCKKLPSSFFTIPEPTIIATDSAYLNPDFVIVGADLGVIILEVKDWKNIKKLSKQNFTIQRSNGDIVEEKNPLNIAKEYMYNLTKRLEENKDLLQIYKGKKRFRFHGCTRLS